MTHSTNTLSARKQTAKFGRFMISSALTAATLVVGAGAAYATSTPMDGTTTQGSATTTHSGNTYTTEQASDRAVTEYNSSLLVKGDEKWRINQPGSTSLSAHRVLGRHDDPSKILGELSSNGRVLIIDPNGVFFGAGSRVDTAGIIATTGDVSNDQIMNNDFGNYTIENMNGTGSIELNGQITIAEAGLAAFVAPTVKNNGVINAKLGKVVFASGEKVTLDLYGDKLVEIEVAGDGADALLDNAGTIAAEGGHIQMTAASAKQAVDNIINVEGVVTAASATRQGGKIVLSGGNAGVVKVAGKVDASGKTGGGSIDVNAQDIQVADTAEFDASATDFGDGGRIDVIAENHLDFRGAVISGGGKNGGNGGFAEVSGYGILGYTGRADLSAKQGTMGTLLLDPEFAVIHSGVMNNPLGLGYVLSAQALANSMETASIIVQADNFIDVGTHNTAYNTGNAGVDAVLNSLIGTGDIDLSTFDYNRLEQTGTGSFWGIPYPIFGWVHYTGTTAGNIQFDTATLNINKDLTLGTGNMDILASTVNMNARLYDVNGLLGQGDITSIASTVNVLSNAALIQQGIYAAAAGADVNVGVGTYAESVNVDKTVHLYGAADHASLINPNSPGFYITADGAIVDGFAIDGASGADGYGVWVDGAADVTVSNNKITNSNINGIRGNNANDLTLDNNEIDGTNNGNRHDGIGLYNSDDAVITNNKISTTGMDAIYLNGSQNAVVTDNIATDFKDSGITFHNGSHGGHAEYNAVTGGNKGGFWLQSNNLTIINNDVSGSGQHGIYSTGNSYNIKAEENKISGIGQNGIRFDNGTNVTLIRNKIDSTGQNGIYMASTPNAAIKHNRIENTGANGINIVGSGGTQLINNKIGQSGTINGDGIYVADSDGTQGNRTKIARNKINNTQTGISESGSGIQLINSDHTLVNNNTVKNADWDGIRVIGGDKVNVKNNEVTKSQRAGIFTKDLTNSDIQDNTIDGTNQFRGLVVNNGTNVNVTDNMVMKTKLDGIFLKNGNNVTVSGNTTNFSGANGILVEGTDNFTLSENSSFMSDEDGIHAENFENAYIKDNILSFTTDDGIEVINGTHVEIEGNIMGHIGHHTSDADGIRVEDVDHSVIKYNAIADVLDDGIRVSGGSYTGIFGNHILMTGDDGIDVSGVYQNEFVSPWIILGDADYPEEGYHVSIQDNEIVLTGDDGIDVSNSESLVIRNNDILFAGVGEENVSDVVNEVADELDAIFSGPGAFAISVAIDEVVTTPAETTFTWGDGSGIDVSNIQRSEGIIVRRALRTGSSETSYPFPVEGEWTVLIQGNDISWTGGHGIEVQESGTTLIGGHDESEINTIYQASIDTMSVHGFDSFRDWVESGPFADEEARRDVWWEEDLTGALEGYLTTDLTEIGHDSHDGIYVAGINNSGYHGPVGEVIGETPDEEPTEHGYYGYAVNIIGNDINTTGDDGIEVKNSSSALIQDNTIMGAGIGGYSGAGLLVDPEERVSYGSADYAGGDGINASNIYGENSIIAGSYTEGYEEYALVIDGNIINGTDDDGIEVVNAGRTLITRNDISEAGVGSGYLYGSGGIYGSDGIHVRDVSNHSYFGYDGTDGEGNYYNYGVNILDNTVDVTADDGIEVIHSDSTVIADNTVMHAGYGRSSYYEGGDFFGADAIHVRDVYSNDIYRGEGDFSVAVDAGFDSGNGFTEYSVVIENNTTDTTGDDGVQVLFSGDTRIAHNTISNSGTSEGARIFGGDGINILAFGEYGEFGESYSHIEIVENNVTNSLDDGVDVMGTNLNVLLEQNDINVSGDNGVRLLSLSSLLNGTDSEEVGPSFELTGFNSTILDNSVSNSGNIGLNVEGEGHDAVEVAGNTFTNNPVGARFESGQIDISSLSNPNTITNTNPAATSVGLQFDGSPETLSIVDQTIGATTFDGFANIGSFYVRFEDGSILDPVTGAPLLINGLDASFDGFAPPADGILSQAQRNYLETRIYDADDAPINSRGQLFVGFVPDESGSIENIEDFFNRFGAFGGAVGNIQVTIASLPYIQQPNNQVPGPAALNNLAPAAGEEDDNAEGLADIEPAAGDEGAEEVNCWGDAANNASGGKASSFSFGGAFGDESLAQAAGCNTASAL